MRTILFAVAAAALFALPATASAGQAGTTTTDISSQSIQVGPGGVRVGHDRWDSRRRGRDRVIIRGRGRDRDCRTVTVRERLPGGGTRTIKRREC